MSLISEWPAATVHIHSGMPLHEGYRAIPRMTPREFSALRQSIRRNGQRDPVIVDCEGNLLDGRERILACEELGIEPWGKTYEGDDAVGVLYSLNFLRASYTHGEIAMGQAIAFPEPRPDRDPEHPEAMAESAKARFIRKHAPHLVPRVMRTKVPDLKSRKASTTKLLSALKELDRSPAQALDRLLETDLFILRKKGVTAAQLRDVAAFAAAMADEIDRSLSLPAPAAPRLLENRSDQQNQ